MKILNVRLGLATNSSSTHSLIFLPKGAKAAEIDTQGGRQCYGWDYFQLTMPESKLDYLAQSLFQQCKAEMGEEVAKTIAEDWCKRPVDHDGYIDHQSEWTLPRNWEGKGINKEFFEDFKAFLMRDDIVIAGGNDNDDGSPEALSGGGKYINGVNIPEECYGSTWVARKDGDYWTLFNRQSGAKIRMTFKGETFGGVPARSQSPELIDIKITDYCPFECAYCYQGSTKEGEHADDGWLSSLAYSMKDLQVFEVAIGGGEPTLHPKFVEILQSFRWNDIVPNFTTKNLGWLKDKEKADKILKLAGAFAYSCEKAEDVNELAALLKKRKIEHQDGYVNARNITIQHVVGVAEEAEFKAILEACAKHHFQITLLGYKMVGRGPEFGSKPSSKWLDIVREVTDDKWLRVGIDTALADRHWDDLIKAGVKPTCMTRVEGQFSCYIDAVTRTINVSSYTTTPGLDIAGNPYRANIGELYRALPLP